MFYDILDKKRIAILPLLKEFKEDFYLVGGTALALQIGHRDSIDFDFFCYEDIDTQKLFEKVKKVFQKHKVLKTQDEKNTLTVLVDETIEISFFSYKYVLVDELIREPNLNLASMLDIACMKLSAITSRGISKDYIDLYFILQDIGLDSLLAKSAEKFPDLERNLILKSLVYFNDIEIEPIKFKNNKVIKFEKVKAFLREKVLEATQKSL
ncbi:MAG: nucleotidyl transferase AbiEii/AbiGii toxin family protein [Patescibacteria group bacterium]|nr:nucleotidyl transferase AbiEii/AbiGii toxin family protein [Patescibacteria group bacterium]